MSVHLSAVENAGKRLQNILDNAKKQDLDQLVNTFNRICEFSIFLELFKNPIAKKYLLPPCDVTPLFC